VFDTSNSAVFAATLLLQERKRVIFYSIVSDKSIEKSKKYQKIRK